MYYNIGYQYKTIYNKNNNKKYRYKNWFILFNGSWKGKSLTSRWSIATFDRTNGHIGNEMPQVE